MRFYGTIKQFKEFIKLLKETFGGDCYLSVISDDDIRQIKAQL